MFRGDPNMYELIDVDDEPIIGKFHEEELSAINKYVMSIVWKRF